jgi:general secretion pathway protein C
MGQLGIRLANVAFFVLSCSVVANVVNQVGGSMLVPDEPVAMPVAEAGLAPQPTWAARRAILDRNLFGAQVVSDQAPPPEPDEDLQATRLPLRLLGTIASEDPVAASAAIENTTTRKHEVVRVGDTLERNEGVEVIRIERGRVILQNGARREELKLSDQIVAATKTKSRSQRRTSRRARREQSSSSVRDRLSELAEQGDARSPAAIFSQARILPKYEDGEMVGIELSKIKPDSFYEKVGLEEGDLVTEINGMKIDNPAASKELLEAFTKADALQGKIRKPDGSIVEVSIDAEELQNMMGGSE